MSNGAIIMWLKNKLMGREHTSTILSQSASHASGIRSVRFMVQLGGYTIDQNAIIYHKIPFYMSISRCMSRPKTLLKILLSGGHYNSRRGERALLC